MSYRQYPEVPRPLKEPAARSLEYWARTRGTETALHEDVRGLTYAEWNAYADQLASRLVHRGLGAGDVVALRAATRLEWAVAASAVAKIDATLLPLDPALGSAEVRRLLIDSGASALICDDEAPARLAPALMGLRLKLCASIDTPAAGFADFADLFPAIAPPRFARSQPQMIHYLAADGPSLRALRIPRRRVAPASRSKTPTPEPGASLITLGLHHSWANTQFWTALEAARRIVLMPHYEPAAALQAIERNRVTDWKAFADAFERLAAQGRETLRRFDLSSLTSIGVGAGGAPPALRAWLIEAFGPILTQSYGLPETGLIARLPAGAQPMKPGSCGRLRRGVVVEIRSADGRPLPPNAVGEVWARTPESVERAPVQPCALPGRRDENDFVRTGSAGRLDEDGFLFLTNPNQAPSPSVRG